MRILAEIRGKPGDRRGVTHTVVHIFTSIHAGPNCTV